MSQRIDYSHLSAEQFKRLSDLSGASRKRPIIAELGDLVNIRASQINGCAFCLDMHVKEAKINGQRELRIYHIPVWRESELFTPRERAAFEWAESVTKLSDHGVPDEIYARVREHLTDQEISDLTFGIAIINAWNRLAISFKVVPGSADSAYGLQKAGLS